MWVDRRTDMTQLIVAFHTFRMCLNFDVFLWWDSLTLDILQILYMQLVILNRCFCFVVLLDTCTVGHNVLCCVLTHLSFCVYSVVKYGYLKLLVTAK
jgi:hypothetical protein